MSTEFGAIDEFGSKARDAVARYRQQRHVVLFMLVYAAVFALTRTGGLLIVAACHAAWFVVCRIKLTTEIAKHAGECLDTGEYPMGTVFALLANIAGRGIARQVMHRVDRNKSGKDLWREAQAAAPSVPLPNRRSLLVGVEWRPRDDTRELKPAASKQVHVFFDGVGNKVLARDIVESLHPGVLPSGGVELFSHDVMQWPSDVLAYAMAVVLADEAAFRRLSAQELAAMLKQQEGTAHGQRFFVLMVNV